jgi:hypothetical protein
VWTVRSPLVKKGNTSPASGRRLLDLDEVRPDLAPGRAGTVAAIPVPEKPIVRVETVETSPLQRVALDVAATASYFHVSCGIRGRVRGSAAPTRLPVRPAPRSRRHWIAETGTVTVRAFSTALLMIALRRRSRYAVDRTLLKYLVNQPGKIDHRARYRHFEFLHVRLCCDAH